MVGGIVVLKTAWTSAGLGNFLLSRAEPNNKPSLREPGTKNCVAQTSSNY